MTVTENATFTARWGSGERAQTESGLDARTAQSLAETAETFRNGGQATNLTLTEETNR